MIGRTLLHYRIIDRLGAGGMGEVYRARDEKLHRDVAVKVLPAGVLSDEKARRRFRKEAEALSRISHPHIAALHDFDSSDGIDFLVMELVGGPSLREEIEQKGALPETAVVRLGAQLARGLQAAHEEGIVHRDLKPANLQLTPDGLLKILDFGLARLSSRPVEQSAPTMTSDGQVAGTPAYMSPEQLRGSEVDERTDLYAAGAVLYEMATGRRMFSRSSHAELMNAILNEEPVPPRQAREAISPGLEAVILKALDKDLELRHQSAKDLRVDLERLQHPSGSQVARTAIASPRLPARSALPWAVAGAAILSLALALWAPWGPSDPPRSAPLRFEAKLGDGLTFDAVALNKGPAAVLSPDGNQLAFVARGPGEVSQLYIRSLSQLAPRPLPGTEGARSPFFSPDGQWIGFFAGGRLMKTAVSGGAVVTVARASDDRGGSWGEDGTIVLTPRSARGVGLHRVGSAGGEIEILTIPEGDEITHRWPQTLGEGRVLYTAHGGLGSYDGANLVLETFPNGPRTIVHRGGYHGRYLASGHLVYLSGGMLFAAPFDLASAELTGPAVPVVEGVWTSSLFAGAQFSVSDTGILAYLAGGDVVKSPIHWVSRDGTTTSLFDEATSWADPRFSPDGDKLAMTGPDGTQMNIWIYEWSRDTLTRLTFDPAQDRDPEWTPDGRHVVFSSDRGEDGLRNLYWRPSDGSGEPTRLTEGANRQFPSSWHPSGRFLVFQEQSPVTGWDLKVLELEDVEDLRPTPGAPTALLEGPSDEVNAAFSPDGRFVAYASDESGRFEVYVRRFPGPGGPWQVSTEGGTWPTWSRTHPEILYGTETGEIMVASYTTEGDSLRSQRPVEWSRVQCQWLGVNASSFDLHPDGERVALRLAGGHVPDSVVIVVGFFDELRRLTAEGGVAKP